MMRVLYFMPDNPLKKNSGNKIRALAILKYFKSRGVELDFVSEYSWGEWTITDIEEFKSSTYASNTFVINRKASKKNLVFYFLFYKLPNFLHRFVLSGISSNFPDLVTLRLKRAFNNILKAKTYDYVMINYASWSGLIENNRFINNAVTILDTHDFLTAQNQSKNDIGYSFKEEIRRISLFERAFAISIEEQYIFSQFSTTPIELVPMMIERPANDAISLEEKKYDIIYVASKNPHNIDALNWFLIHVYPLLPNSLNICFIGQITAYVNDSYKNITKIRFVEDLNIYYKQAKIAICPMLSGTGIKIKVIEALSYNLPVVCNRRGIDGLINKLNNGCLVSDDPVEFAGHISTLLTNSIEYNKQASQAKDTFDASYELNTCYKKLDKIFKL
ncbi:MAG TPA: glycosyltransferase [Pedobacter sp.]|jgi:glycosyltransferase involved in cell wall biosynthesis